MLCRFCFSHRNFGCFDLVCLIVPSTFVIFPIGITVICNIICLWMGNLYAATPGQNLTHGVNLHHICTVDAERNMLLVGAVCSVEWFAASFRMFLRNRVTFMSSPSHKSRGVSGFRLATAWDKLFFIPFIAVETDRIAQHSAGLSWAVCFRWQKRRLVDGHLSLFQTGPGSLPSSCWSQRRAWGIGCASCIHDSSWPWHFLYVDFQPLSFLIAFPRLAAP